MWKIADDKCYEELIKNIRAIDKKEIELVCPSVEFMIDICKELHCNVYSIYSKEGKLLAICGMNEEGNGVGIPFLFSTHEVENQSVSFCKEVIGLLKKYFKKYDYMVNLVHKDNKVAIKWIQWLGFTLTEEMHGDLIKFERFNNV